MNELKELQPLNTAQLRLLAKGRVLTFNNGIGQKIELSKEGAKIVLYLNGQFVKRTSFYGAMKFYIDTFINRYKLTFKN